MFAVDRTPLGEKLFYAPGATGCRCRENPGFRGQNSQSAEFSLIVEELAVFGNVRPIERQQGGYMITEMLYGCYRYAGIALKYRESRATILLASHSAGWVWHK